MMIEQLLKNILGDNGKTKIDINEIARNLNGNVELLGDLVDWEIGENSNGTYFKHPSGLLICYKVQQAGHGTSIDLPAIYTQTNYYIGVFPSENQITPGYNSSTVIGSRFTTRMYRGNNTVSVMEPIEVRILTIGI